MMSFSRVLTAVVVNFLVLPAPGSANEGVAAAKTHGKLGGKSSTKKTPSQHSNKPTTLAPSSAKANTKMNDVLKEGETGSFGELSGRKLPTGCVFIFVPSLIAMLTRAEQLKEKPLTETEVIRIRDHATVIVSKEAMVKTLEASRGYKDVDSTDTWKTWLKLRQE